MKEFSHFPIPGAKRPKNNWSLATRKLIDSDFASLKKSRIKPIIALDADGTIWQGDLGESFFQFTLAHGLYFMRPKKAIAGLERALDELESTEVTKEEVMYLSKVAEKSSEWKRYRRLAKDDLNLAWKFLIHSHAGFEHKRLKQVASRFYQRYFANFLHTPVLDLIQKTKSAGGKVYVVSGSNSWLVEGAVSNLGVRASNVLANKSEIDRKGKITTKIVSPLTWGIGKLRRFKEKSKSLPHIAAGDTLGDIWLLQSATQRSIVINPMDLKAYGFVSKNSSEPDLTDVAALLNWRVEHI